MAIEMIYDEDELKFIIEKEDLKDIKQMYIDLQDMRSLKKKIMNRVKCKKCGWCCKTCNAMLTKKDIIKLCSHFHLSFEEFYEKYMDKVAKMPYLKLPCPFLDENNECEIYHVRPKICKEYPFVEFTLVIDPCLLGKEIKEMIENVIGVNYKINEEMQEFADESDIFIDNILNRDGISERKTLHMIVNKDLLFKILEIVRKIN